MEIRDLYEKVNGDYDELIGRLGSERIVMTLLQYFLEDQGLNKLKEAMEAEDYEAAFRAAHGLKGLCANLAFTGVLSPAKEITEALRNGADIEKAKEILPKLCVDYEQVVKEISNYVTGK